MFKRKPVSSGYSTDILKLKMFFQKRHTVAGLLNSYTMGCPPVCGDNPPAVLASGLSYVQVDKHGIYFLPPTSV